MIDPNLFAQPQALDRVKHRDMRIKLGSVRFDRTAGLNALFITAVEFADVCREYPIVFVEAGASPEGKREVAPMAVLGLERGENLMLGADGRWLARYVPAILRAYPLAIVPTGPDNYAVCFDAAADAFSDHEGERLFDETGAPSAFLGESQKLIESIEIEAQRTRLIGQRLVELELLRPMRFDANSADGRSISVEGFLALDEDKANALPEATVFELHKSGVLAMLHAHSISLGLMRVLAERRLARLPATA